MGGQKASSEAERLVALNKSSHKDGPKAKKKSASYGKTIRKAVPRDVLSSWTPLANRSCVNGTTQGTQAPKSAFAFFCDRATTMANDLSHMPNTGIEVQLCGNAQITNFGIVASSARRSYFDMLSFDETCRGPWEWDIARLCASIEVCGREYGFSRSARRDAVREAAQAYRLAMREFANMGTMRMWQATLDVGERFGKRAVRDARRRYAKSMASLLDQMAGKDAPQGPDQLHPGMWDSFCSNLSERAISLLKSYHIIGVVPSATKLGLEELVVMLEGASGDDVFALSMREVSESALDRYVAKTPEGSHAQRVVCGQRTLQAKEDMFLGWATLPTAEGHTRDFYARQLCASAGFAWLESGNKKMLRRFSRACGWTLAHAHARSGNRYAIAAYLGQSPVFENALWEFARTYANQNEADYRASK